MPVLAVSVVRVVVQPAKNPMRQQIEAAITGNRHIANPPRDEKTLDKDGAQASR
jgi:hypothetical protein